MEQRLLPPLQEASSLLTGKLILLYSSESMDQRTPDGHPSISAFTDAELLNSLKTKQPEALRCLYDRYSGVVYGVAVTAASPALTPVDQAVVNERSQMAKPFPVAR